MVKYPHVDSQTSLKPVQGDQYTPLSTRTPGTHMTYIHMNRQNIHTNKIKLMSLILN